MPQRVEDLKTVGYVLRRTNFGEADRILNLITPVGKLAVVARGVRKMQSKLAGSVEPFTRSEFNIHQGRQELGVLTGAKMQRFYGHILQDLDSLNLATKILKRVNGVAEHVTTAEYFTLVDESLAAIDARANLGLVEAWFLVNLRRVMGEEINLYRDVAGQKLTATTRYDWNSRERAFKIAPSGQFGASEIKLLRLMASNELNIVRRVKLAPSTLRPIAQLMREFWT